MHLFGMPVQTDLVLCKYYQMSTQELGLYVHWPSIIYIPTNDSMAKKWVTMQLLFGYCQNYIQVSL